MAQRNLNGGRQTERDWVRNRERERETTTHINGYVWTSTLMTASVSTADWWLLWLPASSMNLYTNKNVGRKKRNCQTLKQSNMQHTIDVTFFALSLFYPAIAIWFWHLEYVNTWGECACSILVFLLNGCNCYYRRRHRRRYAIVLSNTSRLVWSASPLHITLTITLWLCSRMQHESCRNIHFRTVGNELVKQQWRPVSGRHVMENDTSVTRGEIISIDHWTMFE